MAETKERTSKDWLKIILPRILRAAIWGFIMGGELLIPLMIMPNIGGELMANIPIAQTGISYFLFIFVGFEVAIQLLRGTILQHALTVTRAVISMIVLVFMAEGGIMNFSFASSTQMPLPPGVNLTFTLDFRIILSVFLIFSLLSIGKNILQTIDFLYQKTEEPVIPPELP